MIFEDLLKSDVKDVFLKEFSMTAIFKSDNKLIPIQIQFFGESLDKLGTMYYHAWCANADVPFVKDHDRLTVNDVEYGIVDVAPDEFHTGVNLFLQKV